MPKKTKRAFTGLAGSPLASHGPGRPRKHVDSTDPVVESLRTKYGFSTRDLARILDDKEFNRPWQVNDEEFGRKDPKMRRWLKEIEKEETELKLLVHGSGSTQYVGGVVQVPKIKSKYKHGVLVRPGTMEEWRSLLPLKWVTCLTPAEISFYKDYANRTLTKTAMKLRHGEVTMDQIGKLEDRIVRRGFHCNLLHRPKGLRSADFERDVIEGWELENRAIANGSSYVGSIHGKSVPGSRPLSSFGTTSRMTDGPEAAEDTGGPEHDDYGDESSS